MALAHCTTAVTRADETDHEGEMPAADKSIAGDAKNIEVVSGSRRIYDCLCCTGLMLAAAALLLLTVRASWEWSGSLLVVCVPLICLNGAMLVEIVAAYVSRDAAEELAFALGVTAYKACLALTSLARTAAFGASPRCGDGGCGGCRACSPDLRWIGVYLPTLLTVYHDDFRPLVVALPVMWAARNVADAVMEAAAERPRPSDSDHDQWPLPADARRPAATAAFVDAAAGAAACAAYALCGGRQTAPIALLVVPLLVGFSVSPKCSDASDRSAADVLRRTPMPSAASAAAYVVELSACASLVVRASVAADGGLSLALHVLNLAVALRRLHCTGLLYLVDLGGSGSELPGLRKLTAAERAAYEDVCAVCLSALDGSARMTECGHSFHRQCIRRCLEERPTCPMCQRNILK